VPAKHACQLSAVLGRERVANLRPRFLGTDDLYRDGRKVGDDASVCQLMADLGQADGRFQCLATMSLPHGQLTAQGLITHNEGGSEPFTVAITGGTGAYRTAHGGGLESVAAGVDLPAAMFSRAAQVRVPR
jgi:hypothetical protein